MAAQKPKTKPNNKKRWLEEQGSTHERDKAYVAVKTGEITGVKGAADTRSVARYLPGISAWYCLVCIFPPHPRESRSMNFYVKSHWFSNSFA